MSENGRSLFSVFGISMSVYDHWHIYPENRGQELSYSEGFVKFEKRGIVRKKGEVTDGEGSISVGLRWSPAKEDMTNEDFMVSYVEQLIASDQKKRFGRTQQTLNIRRNEQVEVNGQTCVYLECDYMASVKLRGGSAKRVVVLNLAFLDEESRRVIIGTAMAEEATMTVRKDELESVLMTLSCGRDF